MPLRRRHLLAAVVAAGALAAATAAVAAPRARPGGPGTNPGGPLVTLAGDVEGLHPGAVLTLPVVVTNTQAYEVRLTAVRVDVAAAGPTCPGTSIAIPTWQGGTLVPARGTNRIELTVTMPHEVADGCAGAEFPLTFVGDAQPARL